MTSSAPGPLSRGTLFTYHQVRADMVDLIGQDGACAERAVELVLVARYLERVADHITNVGERLIYMETGALKELH